MSQISVKLYVADVGDQDVKLDGTTTLDEIIDFIVESYSTYSEYIHFNI